MSASLFRIRPALLATLLLSPLRADANAFFAMDTGISGEPAQISDTLYELGFDGLGGSGDSVKPMREAIEDQGLKLWNVYLTLKFKSGASALTPELRQQIDELKGSNSTLWIAIQEAPKDGGETAVKSLTEIADFAKQAGVKISLYPHAGFWLSRFPDAAKLADMVNREEVGITFNLCHWLKTEGDVDPLPAIIKEKAKLQFVTINGADKGDTKSMGWDRLIQPLGQGSYNVAGFLRKLQVEADWKGPVGLQSYGIKGNQRQNLTRSMAAWRKMSGKLDGMVMAGYQGWFRTGDDGSRNGWFHYSPGGKFGPDSTHIDMWPDMTELGPDERFPTPLRHADGSVAEVFSSVKEPTVRRHFKWMKDYGIDGVFVQRFATSARDGHHRASMDIVLRNCKNSAAAEGRKWVLMYDLSGLRAQNYNSIPEDWERLKKDELWSTEDPSYLHYRGKPLISLWGLGFNDRPPCLTEWEELVKYFKNNGCAVMLGVPCYWRTFDRDTINDPKLHEIMLMADIVSPWAVGRFGTPQDAANRVDKLLKPDLAWCRDHNLDYLPVAFPGFSWHNLQKSRNQQAKLESIPRLGGRFLWSQAIAARQAGNRSLYIAMFDEIDEGTAIFKTSQNPPVGEVPFVFDKSMKSDHFLWLTGEIGKMLRGERSVSEDMPARAK
ncbi:TIM barrel protein [Luteolibacter luteus]|uniref:TIM barrel protein n=1 Tax=Luteolibacter luteus TaxID=2728835 RepID=A0A858RPA1_9BACT|nr:TIM barrel protein [Luteolibacter luteus]QJE98847.1 TIM barrel protein [Luteolibacter luteus]